MGLLMVDRLYRHSRLLGIGLIAALINACGGGGSSAVSPETTAFYVEETEEEWGLVWSDEFDGSSVDESNWTFQLGDGSDYGLPAGWGNGERQWYQPDNATIGVADIDGQDESVLVITAKEEQAGGLPYTSSRMRSIGKFDFKYGRVEMRAKAAAGQGLWSAIWMMPSDSPYGTLAASGEVDIMEVVNAGTENQGVFMAAHHGFEWPQNQIVTAPADVDDASPWHTAAREWCSDFLRWYVDGELLRTVKAVSYYSYFFKDNESGYELAADSSAPFNQDFHLIVNLAVGGNGPVWVNNSDVDGSTLEVDYIRVYKCQEGAPGGVGCNENANRDAEDPATPDAFVPGPSEAYVYESVLFGDAGLETLTWPSGERELVAEVGFANDGAIAVSADEAAVSIVSTGGGNAVINAADDLPFELTNFYGAGELKFEMYIDSSGTAPFSDLLIKMDSGYPAFGQQTLSVSDLPKDEWFSYSIPVKDFVNTPNGTEGALNLQSVMNLMVVEPTAAASLKLRNVSLKCGTPYKRGCGIKPPAVEGDGSTLVVLDELGVAGGFWSLLGIGASDSRDNFAVPYYESNSLNHITWSNNSEGLLVTFNLNAFGVWYVRSPEPGIDLSAYEDAGVLRFELKAPEPTLDAGLNFKVENTFPNGTGDMVLTPYITDMVPNEWYLVEVPVADLLASANAEDYDPSGAPLDIEAVQSAIVLWPNAPQAGLTFEIRNVRYENDAVALGCPAPPQLYGAANIADAFGGANITNGVYTFPSEGSEVWGGFAQPFATNDLTPMVFENGGFITFDASVPSGEDADVRFVLEFLPYPDNSPSFSTEFATVSGSENQEFTLQVAPLGTTEYNNGPLFYIATQDVGVALSNVKVYRYRDACDLALPVFGVENFGGTSFDSETGEFVFPSTAQVWGGFANTNAELYPIVLPRGGVITFNAALPEDSTVDGVDVRFKFEKDPHPDTEPSYSTAPVTVIGTEVAEYEIAVPSLDGLAFNNFLMFLDTQDAPVIITDIVISANGAGLSESE